MESDPFIGYIAYNIHMEQNLSESILCIYTYYINTDEMEHKYNPLNTIFYMGFVPSGNFTNIAMEQPQKITTFGRQIMIFIIYLTMGHSKNSNVFKIICG